ncbi:hypothetical protein LCGC14_2483250, partial [marine sediment metagenome]
AEALAVGVEFGDPDNETDNDTSDMRIYQLVAHDNISYWGDAPNTVGAKRTVLWTGDVITIDYDDDPLDEWIVLGLRPKYLHPFYPSTPEYPAPEYVHVSTWRIYDLDYDELLLDNISFEISESSQTWGTRGGFYTGFDYGEITMYPGWPDVICAKFSDNVYEDHDNYWERGKEQDSSWKWWCPSSNKGYDPMDWDPSTPECDEDFPGTDVIPYLSNLGQWLGHGLTNRSTPIWPVAYRDIVLAELDDDGDVEALVTADRSMLIDNNTGQPYYLSYITMYEAWRVMGCGYCEWLPVDNTSSFVGSPRKIESCQFDTDGNDEFVITNWLDNQTNTQIRIYDDNLTLIAASQVVPGKFTTLQVHDFDGDGISEIIVGYLHSDNNSSIRIYDASAGLLKESNDYTNCYFSDFTLAEIPPGGGGDQEPTTCTEVHSMGYGLATDLDKSCYVNWGDFSVFAGQWLATDCGNPADFDNSACSGGSVDWGDFSIFAGTWLDCNDPTNMPPCIA